MTIGTGQIVSGRVYRWDLANGVGAAESEGQALYDFILDGTYAPSGAVGVPCDDDAKGSLKLYAYQEGPNGNPVTLNVVNKDTGTIEPIDVSAGIPLNVYAVDGTEPWMRHVGPTSAMDLILRTVFVLTDGPPQIVDEWTESWVL